MILLATVLVGWATSAACILMLRRALGPPPPLPAWRPPWELIDAKTRSRIERAWRRGRVLHHPRDAALALELSAHWRDLVWLRVANLFTYPVLVVPLAFLVRDEHAVRWWAGGAIVVMGIVVPGWLTLRWRRMLRAEAAHLRVVEQAQG